MSHFLMRIVVAFTLLGSACYPRELPANIIEFRLSLDGVDVTEVFRATAVVSPIVGIAGDAGARLRPISCALGIGCRVPSGAYVLRVRAEQVIEAERRAFVMPADDPASFQTVAIPVCYTGHLRVLPSRLPADSILDVVSLKSGLLFQWRVSEGARSMTVPAGALIVGIRDNALRPSGFFRVDVKREEILDLPPLPSLQPGRGQLFVGFFLGGDPNHRLRPRRVNISPVVSINGKKQAPDVGVSSEGNRYFAFWTDLPVGDTEISIESDEWRLPSPIFIEVTGRVAASVAEVELVPKSHVD